MLLLPLMTTEVLCTKTTTIRPKPFSFTNCTREAHTTYAEAMAKLGQEEDGKPNYRARKSCNFIVSVENCADKLKDNGYTSDEEALEKIKDTSIWDIIGNLNTTVSGWDSCKCPPVRAHLNRTMAIQPRSHRTDGCPEVVENSSDSSTVINTLLLLPLIIIHQL